MLTTPDLFHLAAQYHQSLPDRIRKYLNGRSIPDEIIDRHFLGWNGSRITLPVFNRNGVCAFFRLARDPDDTSNSPKMLSSRGNNAELYGWEMLRLRPTHVIICEGEFDRMVLEANGFEAVTSTGGAGTFRKEWADAVADISQVYVCFDRDDAGHKGALRVGRMIPHAKLVELPEEVGEGGDVTDFFVRLGQSADDFRALLALAKMPVAEEQKTAQTTCSNRERSLLHAKAERIKRYAPIADVVDHYLQLRRVGKTYVGLCPFHKEHSPSFTVYPDSETFHCFGCGAHGDALTFLQKVEGWSFKQALYMLDQFGGGHESRIE